MSSLRTRPRRPTKRGLKTNRLGAQVGPDVRTSGTAKWRAIFRSLSSTTTSANYLATRSNDSRRPTPCSRADAEHQPVRTPVPFPFLPEFYRGLVSLRNSHSLESANPSDLAYPLHTVSCSCAMPWMTQRPVSISFCHFIHLSFP